MVRGAPRSGPRTPACAEKPPYGYLPIYLRFIKSYRTRVYLVYASPILPDTAFNAACVVCATLPLHLTTRGHTHYIRTACTSQARCATNSHATPEPPLTTDRSATDTHRLTGTGAD